jgi:hypothetical protein
MLALKRVRFAAHSLTSRSHDSLDLTTSPPAHELHG